MVLRTGGRLVKMGGRTGLIFYVVDGGCVAGRWLVDRLLSLVSFINMASSRLTDARLALLLSSVEPAVEVSHGRLALQFTLGLFAVNHIFAIGRSSSI